VELSLDGKWMSSSELDSPLELFVKKDVQRVSHMFDYGRYLFLSSASQAVSNLQGLWGDGKGCMYLCTNMMYVCNYIGVSMNIHEHKNI
jgi:hypothetical protein